MIKQKLIGTVSEVKYGGRLYALSIGLPELFMRRVTVFESVHSLLVCCAAAVSGGRENVIVSLCSDGECSLHAINAPKCGKGSVIYGYYGPGWVEIREYFGFAMANSDKHNMCFDCFAFSMRLFRPMDYHCTRRSLTAPRRQFCSHKCLRIISLWFAAAVTRIISDCIKNSAPAV